MVNRCSWFYKGTTDPRFVPYAEDISDLLEVIQFIRYFLMKSLYHLKIILGRISPWNNHFYVEQKNFSSRRRSGDAQPLYNNALHEGQQS